MSPAPTTTRTEIALAAAATLATALVLSLAFHHFRCDDAYISYRYGVNLARGLGLVFNPGERVMGSTAPGHALLSAGAYAVAGLDGLPALMSVIGCLGWAAEAAALYWLLRSALGRAGAAGVAACVAAGAALSMDHVALETHLAVSLVLWGMVAARAGRWTPAAALLAVAGFVRPDAYLAGGLVAAACAAERRLAAWRPAAVFLGLSLPWPAFAWWHFGSPLPQSAAAKVGTATVAEYARHLLTYPLQAFSPADVPEGALVPLAAVAWGLAASGAVVLVRRDRRAWPLPAWGVAHLAAYLFLRPYTSHVWHVYPGVLVFTVLVLSAIAAPIRGAARPAARIAAIAAVTVLGLAWFLRSATASAEYDATYWGGGRDRAYRATAAYLIDHAKPTDVVASVEVGTIGYYSDLPMYDWGGLVTPEPFDFGTRPEHRFVAVDRLYVWKARGLHPVAEFRHADFAVLVCDLASEPPGTRPWRSPDRPPPRP
ncbi:MAG: hypothetical protein FJ087_08290 [Deltaproteobacteria bacterium]|nr:hypothetical protein [Deltaproteobacteria bacterium]